MPSRGLTSSLTTEEVVDDALVGSGLLNRAGLAGSPECDLRISSTDASMEELFKLEDEGLSLCRGGSF